VTYANIASSSRTIHILAISGSLRRVSSNTALLQAAISLSPKTVEMKLYDGLGDLPVTDLRAQVKWSDGLVISTPEYAHGVPGVLKNALDWLVSGEEFIGKPIALFNASPRAIHAQASLTEIVKTMTGRIVPEAAITVSLLGKKMDVAGILADQEISGELRAKIVSFTNAIKQFQKQ
jgi:chromate reductase, NAD(P)H dehydrogenase (quinone)